MDNVPVDFKSGLDKIDEATKSRYEGHLDDIPGLFGLMEPMPWAVDAVHRLADCYDVFILSTAPWKKTRPGPTRWDGLPATIDLNHWLEGFRDTEESVRETVETIRTHPLIPPDVVVRGFIIDSETGLLEEVR